MKLIRCMKCNKHKVDLIAYVPYNGKSRSTLGKPGFICKDCLREKEVAKNGNGRNYCLNI